MTSFGSNAGYVDDLYQQYLADPNSVSEVWREFFADYHGRIDSNFQRRPISPDELPGREIAVVDAPASDVPPAADEAIPAAPIAEPLAVPDDWQVLRGARARIVENMEQSLSVPTATSVRTIPAKLLEENRRIINQHQLATAHPKVSFTHLVAYAIARAIAATPALNHGFELLDGTPHRVERTDVALGIAIDVEKRSGERLLLVPNIKNAAQLSFESFLTAYEELVLRARSGALVPDDFAGTTVTITNPGMIGTVLSVPRLMAGQGAIIGIGSIGYPPHCAGMTAAAIAELGISKVMTLTSTYDHRIIQGAESGRFLAQLERLLLGGDGFYPQVFRALGVPHEPMQWAAAETSRGPQVRGAEAAFADAGIPEAAIKQAKVLQLIRAFRVRGHLMAKFNPLGRPPEPHPELELYSYGLSIWDLDRPFISDGVGGRGDVANLRNILEVLRSSYCQYIGSEFMHIPDPEKRAWIQRRVEVEEHQSELTIEQKIHILEKLNEAEAFERFLGNSYIGQKRFSLEGCETLVPMLDALLEEAAGEGVEEVVIGMAHRGRLNVLVNLVGKSLAQVFAEFEDMDPQSTQGSGDVKYHQGATGAYTTTDGDRVNVSLASNPSHLEAVDPVVEGMARALQDHRGAGAENEVVPILVHGDAAFAGQGVVYETLNMSQLEGYRTGGTVHIVVNNQIGFTTRPKDARSSRYATDMAKGVGAPVFHVSADHPQAACRVIRRAFAFRQRFHCDVVIDLVGYRRWGHNEGDEPALTQPLMYEEIRNHRSVRKLAMERLLRRGEIDLETGERLLTSFQERLRDVLAEVRKVKAGAPPAAPQPCLEESEGNARPHVETGVPAASLRQIAEALRRVPSGFVRHPKLDKILEKRAQEIDSDRIAWGLAEALAIGSLALEGTRVRLSGQDSGRGTFNHRHARIIDHRTGASHIPLAHLSPEQAPFEVWDSPLSEYGVLGFEYGYSVVRPEALVLWEAQFGDFANGAQIIIDQFISSAEEKWGQRSSLVLLLPNGYEGQGPEHSSARLERFLQLASEGNMQIVNCSTPAQYFHLLRRQVLDGEIKPLIVMTPKSLLRLPAATSPLSDFCSGSFDEVLDDDVADPDAIDRVVLMAGKVYYDAQEHRQRQGLENVALVRLEQFYPFAGHRVAEILDRYPRARDVVWLQEEPRNMGAWDFLDERLSSILGGDRSLRSACRCWSASPASGSHARHAAEQEMVLDLALRGAPDRVAAQR